MITLRRILLSVLALAAPIQAQMLARPGWAGSGITTDLWWKHAVIYQVNPANFSPGDGTPLHGLAQRLDYIRSLGADALLLTPIQPDATHAQQLNPALGTPDDLDDLIHEASRRDLRVLLDLDPAIPSADLPNVARFWLNRGLAGFHVTGTADAAQAQAAELRKATASYLGQRILISDSDLTSQLHLIPLAPSKLTAADLRPAIDLISNPTADARSLPLLFTDSPATPRSLTRFGDGQHDLAIAKVLAALLFTTRANALLYYGQELGVPEPASPNTTTLINWSPLPTPVKNHPTPTPAQLEDPKIPYVAAEDADPDSLLNWYRQLSALHHGNATINDGATTTVNLDDQNVLVIVRKPKAITPNTPPLVIVCNLSAQPATLSLKAEITKLHLRGSFLKTVLRSDKGMGTMHLESMTIAPYTAYIGQLRF